MLQNHRVYKGYRLTAKVQRLPAQGSSGPVFAATVSVDRAADDEAVQPIEQHTVPCFAEGGFVFSPREAVHAAIIHGCHVVDRLQEDALRAEARPA